CELNEAPQATATEEDIFGTESGLKTYSYSFYNNLPSGSNAYRGDVMADYGAVNSLNGFLVAGAYSAETSSGCSWATLRNVNHFIGMCKQPNVSEERRKDYLVIAGFFCAWFYVDMVVRFGHVPWIDQPLAIDETAELYGERHSRVVVMKNVM